MSQYYYGVLCYSQIFNTVHKVCRKLGMGKKNNAPAMVLETIAVETQMGTYPDTTENSGHGLTQFDKIGFDDTVARTRTRDKEIVKNVFGYDLDELTVRDLDENPELAIIMCRLKYKLIPEPFPTDIVSRAAYWKRFYNSTMGKGTIEHYLESAERHLYPEHS